MPNSVFENLNEFQNTCGLNLKCNGDCISSTCSRCFRNAHFPDQKPISWKKPFHKQRYSLDPKSWIEDQNKILAENNNNMVGFLVCKIVILLGLNFNISEEDYEQSGA